MGNFTTSSSVICCGSSLLNYKLRIPLKIKKQRVQIKSTGATSCGRAASSPQSDRRRAPTFLPFFFLISRSRVLLVGLGKMVGRCRLNSVDPVVESACFQNLNLKVGDPVSSLCFQIDDLRYMVTFDISFSGGLVLFIF